MINKIKKYLNPSSHRNLKVEKSKEAIFRLVLDRLEVGRLFFKDGKWMFKYSDEFKEANGIKPLSAFPNIDKTYIDDELWPFFASRIPSLSREKVRETIAEEGIQENDLLALLNRFGRRTITNPFELLSVE
ncbi:MAG: HipA N-terminal domain-containing protein [Fulvivirga sp.]